MLGIHIHHAMASPPINSFLLSNKKHFYNLNENENEKHVSEMVI